MSKIDNILKQADFYEKLAIYSDRSLFLRMGQGQSIDLRPNSTEIGDVESYQPYDQNTQILPKPTAKPSIPKETQRKLSEIMVRENWGIPLTLIDGIIGPATKDALNNFKREMNMQNASLLQVIKAIDKKYEEINSTKTEKLEELPNDFSWMDKSYDDKNTRARNFKL